MGIKGELVRNVFLRNRSFKTHERNTRNSNSVERKKWHSVRSYLCGDEYNSALVEEDAASTRSSEATVTQPVDELEVSTQIQDSAMEDLDFGSEMKRREQAALIIQSAFRSFLARRRDVEIEWLDNDSKEINEGTGSPSGESLSTSIEVQTGNSEAFSVQEERNLLSNRVQQKSKSQLHKLKEEWDDSTVSSNVSKLRIQNRLEASSRRERALAYAFSQQLRICSKKNHSKSDAMEANVSWSWLERWMATRLPEGSSVETHTRTPSEAIDNNQRLVISQRLFDIAAEEKESCGSNEVSVRSVNFSADAVKGADGNLMKNRSKNSSYISRKTVPNLQLHGDCTKASKRDWVTETERDERSKEKQAGDRGEIKCKDAYINSSPSSSPVESRIEFRSVASISSMATATVNAPAKRKPVFIKVEELKPGTTGHTLNVKVVSSKNVKVVNKAGRSTMLTARPQQLTRISECLVGDETGSIVFTARNEQVDIMKPGSTVTLRNAKIDMFKGSMRLAVDKWGRVEAAEEPASFEVKEDNNLSLVEYELVNVEE